MRQLLTFLFSLGVLVIASREIATSGRQLGLPLWAVSLLERIFRG